MRTRSTCVVLCLVSSAACAGQPVATVEAVAVPRSEATAVLAAIPTVRDDVGPPWTLTASDGSGLVLARVDARAVVEGPLAFTELHLYFRNDQDRVREGTFQITLPAHAAVSRFAMESAGHWSEAEVVPKLVARRAYDDFLHRRQDPALLEKAAGNQFTAKVFPIAARAEKHLVISYSQALPGLRYTLPLRGLPKAARVDVALAVTGSDGARTTQRLAERDWQPDHDFVSASPATAAAVTAGTLVAAQIELAGHAERDVPRGITLVVDTSASRGLGFAGYVASVRALILALRAQWGDALPLAVVAFDQDTELVFEGRAAELGEPAIARLRARGAAGASDLGQALAWIASPAGRGAQHPRVVVVSDGVITAGAEGHDLQARVAQLAGAGVERLDVVLAGGLRDDRTAALVVRAGLAHAGAVLDLEADPVAIALGESVATDVSIDVPGAAWVYPRTIATARPGTKVMVLARLARPASTLDVVAGGDRRTIHALAGTAPLVERAVAGAELAELEAKLPAVTGAAATALRTAIANKSVATRVLSSETSLLVLESDADYARYGIARQALADVLVVGPRGVERMPRGDAAPIPPHVADPKAAAPEDTRPRITGEPMRPPGSEPLGREPPASGPGGDLDHDGIPDQADGCPDEPATQAGAGDGDGCPVRGRVIVTSTAIMVLDRIYFESDRAVITRVSTPLLDAVAATLLGNPDIARVEIQGHSDERGDDGHNLALSELRAAAVKQYLVGKGVADDRLVSQGYGESMPIDPAHTASAWAKNRRVDFLIVQRGGEPRPSTAQAGAPGTPPVPARPPEPPAVVTGELAAIEHAVAAHDLEAALASARDWHAREPGNVLALIGLGDVLEARHDDATAARIYGSIIDLFPGRADMRRFAGERLGRLSSAGALVIDTYRRAVADRPDHLTGHRLLAHALVRAGKWADAFAAILAGLDQPYRNDSYAGGLRVLGDDAGMIGAAYAAQVPAKRGEITTLLAAHKLALATRPSTRFLLYWETDANDVDFHIVDARGGHAFYGQPKLASGGELYADITTGYGPECFAIPGKPQAGPYQLSLDYFSQGPMGYGMGLLEIETFDPGRGFGFEDRPYVIMNNHAKVDLGAYR
jgi:outer membrane protein OmpA-like peptidoglycan-associated protein